MQSDQPMYRLVKLTKLTDGKTTRVEVDGKGVLVCRVEDQVFAVSDTCPHEDISLSLGALCQFRLRCPLHGSEFDIRTGKVLNEPAEENLCTYPVYYADGWVCLEKTLT